jgi:ferric-dicitrate binding protein FerR (iron transport regulator)
MSDCSTIRERFFDRQIRRGDPELEKHLAECEECAQADRAMALLDATIGDRGFEPPAPAFDEIARVAAATARARRRRVGLRRALPFAATLAAAAAAILLVLLARPSHPRAPLLKPGQTIEAAGTAREVVLGSGARVLLDAGRLSASAADPWEESLELDDGAVALHVPKLAGRHSLVVRTPEAEVRVHGTRFRVQREKEQTTVSVGEGLVEIRPQGPGRPARFLGAGESMTVESLERYRHRVRVSALEALGSGQEGLAQQRFDELLATEPGPSDVAEVHANLAWSAAARGDRRSALEHYRVALATLPSDERPAWADNACAERALLLEREEPEAARQAWGEYLDRFPDGIHAALARVRLAEPRER